MLILMQLRIRTIVSMYVLNYKYACKPVYTNELSMFLNSMTNNLVTICFICKNIYKLSKTIYINDRRPQEKYGY